MQRSRDAKHVPCAVGVIGMWPYVDAEGCWVCGEGMRHTHFERSRLQKERMPAMQTLVRLTRLFDGNSKRRGHLLWRWRTFVLHEKLVDEKPHRPVALVLL